MLPEDITCAKDAKEVIVECCIGKSRHGSLQATEAELDRPVLIRPAEWIKLISTQSNTICDESSKKTISPEHVIEALKVFNNALCSLL